MNNNESLWHHELLNAHFHSLDPNVREAPDFLTLLNDVRKVLVQYADPAQPEVGELLSRINEVLNTQPGRARRPMKAAGKNASAQSEKRTG